MFKIPVPAARRSGMLAAGVTLWLGFGLLVLACLECGLERRLTGLPVLLPHEVLLAAWTLAGVVGLAVYLFARAHPTVFGETSPAPAFAVPASGAAALMPLTVQLMFFAVVGDYDAMRDFDEWAPFALGLTAVAHLWFVACVGQRASDLVLGLPESTVKRVYVTTIVAGALPGLIVVGIPCLVVAITGLPILPMLRMMDRYAAFDRGAGWVPTARVVIA